MSEPGAVEVFGERAGLARRYAELLGAEGIEWGLLGPREAPRIWDRHIMNSAALAALPSAGASVLDVGSGAGLPGIVVALARPDLRVWLLEPLLRRVKFLARVVDELHLADQIGIIRGRAEQVKQWECDDDPPASFDVVTCRAVAGLDRLVEWCWPLVAAGGEFVALKGVRAETEVAEASSVLGKRRLRGEAVHLRAWSGAEGTWAVRVTAG